MTGLDLDSHDQGPIVTIIEAIPNVSEGRRPDVIGALADAVRHVPGSRLLDISSDPAHHRSVLTLVGEPDALVTALLGLFDAACRTIDLREHQGEHPRVGAVDVVPFVPLQDASATDCVHLAGRLGHLVAERFALPVFLYGQAATRPERRSLAEIRRGQLPGLADRMQDAAWAPDFGPQALHPTAGATAIGARPPLIAFNVDLDTDDIGIARTIARAVRSSTSGVASIQAIGVRLPDRARAQVSMNLTAYRDTPIHRAFDLVREHAAAHDVGIVRSEIVGLVHADALVDAGAHYLRLDTFRPDQVLESRLRGPMRLPLHRPSGAE